MALRFAFTAAAALLALLPAHAFVATSWCRAHSSCSRSPALSMKWDGKSEPKKNPLLEKLSADASWDRENDRKEVWEDEPNPNFDWISAYLPTDEEREAAAAGYDFNDPEGWFEKQGIKQPAAATA